MKSINPTKLESPLGQLILKEESHMPSNLTKAVSFISTQVVHVQISWILETVPKNALMQHIVFGEAQHL